MKNIKKSRMGACAVFGVLLFLVVGKALGARAQGVYAYVSFRGDSNLKANVRELVSVSKNARGYHVRLTTGQEVVVLATLYRGAVDYPSMSGKSSNELKASRDRLRQFMSKFPASNRYLSRKATTLSHEILRIEKAEKLKNLGFLILKNGKTYKDAVLSEKMNDGVKIIHQQGVVFIPAELLPESVVKKLGGFDASKMKLARDKKMLSELEQKAAKGDQAALWELGKLYHDGESVTKDAAKSFQYFEKAASQGHAPSQLLVGFGHYKGDVTKKDLKLSAEWMTKAAKQGLAEAQTSLGVFYLRGEGLAKDPKAACRWFEKAAKAGNADAQYLLGVCYYLGEGADENHQKAKEWLQKARDGKAEGADKFWTKHNL